ncbi:MAG TPA: aminotransferase class III-fold pyridoxal phosphate-dependent enzyme [Microbacteriaceae bacterium]|nr:aminotransferase class III-fold pyridoxal phosphate-dependent enzyme [Microbacteriaceae bacterium]
MGFDFLKHPELPAPSLSVGEIALLCEREFGIVGTARELGSQQDQNVLLTPEHGEPVVVKVVNPAFGEDEIAAQDAVAELIATRTTLRAARTKASSRVNTTQGPLHIRVMEYLPGGTLTGSQPLSPAQVAAMGEAAARVSMVLKAFDHPGLERTLQWDLRYAMRVVEELARYLPSARRESVLEAARSAWADIASFTDRLPMQAGHFDLTDDNVVVSPSGIPDGVIDFGDVTRSWGVGELATTLSSILHHDTADGSRGLGCDPNTVVPAVRAFAARIPMTLDEIHAIWPLVVLRTAVLVCSGHQQLNLDVDNEYARAGLEREWRMFERATSVPTRMMTALFRAVVLDDPTVVNARDVAEHTRERREAHLAEVQEHYYQAPPQIERGWKNYLISTEPRVYLDMVNNVTSIGHADEGLANVVSQQLRRLNTNSRFHYEGVARFAEELASTLPEPLDTVFLVNSGSEAVDLAIRIAMAATGRTDIVAVREAYHGWTYASDAVSTSIADNPNALETRPSWVHTVAAPNSYRGVYRDEHASKYAPEAAQFIRKLKAQPAGFLAEAWYGNAGGVELPAGYLREVYAAIRERGGLAIADEVQVGYGRLGEWFWGFESQNVVPDIVAVAKSMGNGYPLGAVITSREVAARYREGGYFFSSTGGSPVSSAVGSYVLQQVTQPEFRANVRETGGHLKRSLEDLAARYPLIGAVHGSGLYLGAEFVRDRQTREPATEETAWICDELLREGVIMQPTGDFQNVLKIKPPLCVSRADVDYFVAALDRVLERVPTRS